jgi:uncharacterized Fe-S cluster-containing MiaB family protein
MEEMMSTSSFHSSFQVHFEKDKTVGTRKSRWFLDLGKTGMGWYSSASPAACSYKNQCRGHKRKEEHIVLVKTSNV